MKFDKEYWINYITSIHDKIQMQDINFNPLRYMWIINRDIAEIIMRDCYKTDLNDESYIFGIKAVIDETNTSGVTIFKECEFWNSEQTNI